jgi:hypothetical protein
MTEKQRNTGRAIAIIVMLSAIILGMLNSCSPSLYNNAQKIKVTHVLAVTEEGDTLRLPIEMIKPNIYYNVIGYDYYRPSYYYRPWNGVPYQNYNYNNNNYRPTSGRPPVSSSSSNTMGSSGSVGNSGGNPAVITPPPNPAVNNKKKNN